MQSNFFLMKALRLHRSKAGFAAILMASTLAAALSSSAAAAASSSAVRTSTTTTLSATPNPATIGQQVTLTAKVAAASGAAPNGTVRFSVGAITLASAKLSNGAATITASTAGVAAGDYAVVAHYSGSGAASGSASSALTVRVKSAAPAGTALSACADITIGGAYYLSQNVSSAGTCFFIDADNITLDLNGHTITYGGGGGTASTPGILLADNWYTAPGYGLAQTGSTTRHGGFVLYGGSITAAANAAPRSTCIWVGQSNDISPAPVIHDLVLTTYSTDASPIFGTVSASGWQIYNNTVNYASVTTTSRYNFWGYAVWLGDQLNAPGAVPDQIYGNKITGAPQGGIMDDHQNAQIHNNDITFNAFYANDYCVITYSGDNQVISNNICHPMSGRGIDMEAKGGQVTGNTISVIELAQDAEYGGCEEGGADGIRVRDNVYQGAPSAPAGVIISGNNITATATVCQANALRLTNLHSDDSVTYANNFLTSIGPGNAAVPDYAVSFDGDVSPALTFSSNTLSSVYAFVQVDWDGANVSMDGTQTWANTPLLSIDNENGFNDPADGGPLFSQAISISADASGRLKCGHYAAGPTEFGSTSQTCN